MPTIQGIMELKGAGKLEEYIIRGNIDDILFCLSASLRYALGRRTYSTSLVPEVITNNLDLYNQKWLINNLRDIDGYIDDRRKWRNKEYKYDDICDYSSWLNLKQRLIDEYESRRFEEPLSYYDIWEASLDVYYVTGVAKKHIGVAPTVDGATDVIFNYLIESDCTSPFTYRTQEDEGVIRYYFISHTECFEVEIEKKKNDTLAPDFGKRLPYRGQEYLLGGIAGRKPFFDNAFCVPVYYTSAQIKIACGQIYRDLAQRDLTAKVMEFAETMGVDVPTVRITGAKNKLVSLTKTLNFSWRLVMADDDVIDYVVVCAVASVVEPRHSVQFWKTVEGILPDYLEQRRKLKTLTAQLGAVEI